MKNEPSKDVAFPTKDHHPAARPPAPKVSTPSEDALDQGISESFPASDPVSVTSDKPRQPKG